MLKVLNYLNLDKIVIDMTIRARINSSNNEKTISIGIFTKNLNQKSKLVNVYKLDIIKSSDTNSNNPIWICREYTEVIFN